MVPGLESDAVSARAALKGDKKLARHRSTSPEGAHDTMAQQRALPAAWRDIRLS